MAGSCCAYGPLLLVPIFASTAAFVMTWVFTFDCRFFEASVKEIIDEEHPLLTFGLWTVQDYYLYYDEGYYYDESPYGMCIGWNQHSFLNREDNIDGPLRFARVVSIILSLLSWVLLVVLLFASCMIFSPRAMQSLAWSFGLVGVCCLLCLIALASNLCRNATSCTLGRDGILCIFASLIWVIAAVSVTYLRPIDKYNNKNNNNHNSRVAATVGTSTTNPSNNAQSMVPGTEEIKIQETVSPDGTVTVLTTRSIYNANGTMTVTETREVQAAPTSAYAAAASTTVLPDAPVEPSDFNVTEVKVLDYP